MRSALRCFCPPAGAAMCVIEWPVVVSCRGRDGGLCTIVMSATVDGDKIAFAEPFEMLSPSRDAKSPSVDRRPRRPLLFTGCDEGADTAPSSFISERLSSGVGPPWETAYARPR